MANRKTVKTQSGGNTVYLSKPQLGFNPADTHRNFQVSVTGLGGATYDVKYVPVNTSQEIVFQAGATEADAVVSSSVDFLYETIIVTFNNLGVGADPLVTVTLWPRAF